MTSRLSNRAVTNKNDYVTCIARYLSCMSSAQSAFKGVRWKYIAWLVELSSNVVLKERLTTKKSERYIYVCWNQRLFMSTDHNALLYRGTQWICSSKYLFFMQIFAGWEMWKK